MEINSKVRFLNQQGGGKVINIQGNQCVVLDEDGFEWRVPMSDVVEIELNSMDEIRKVNAKSLGGSDTRCNHIGSSSSKKGGKGIQQKVVDLHQNALIGYSPSMTSIEIHELQLKTIKDVLEKEKSHRGAQIIFIHGKGEGVLRSELTTILSRYQTVCKFEDAPFHTYGYQGAIKVIIK